MNYQHIGWCKDGTHDKVWGIICLQEPTTSYRGDGKFVTFWGRRGKKLQTKTVETGHYEVKKMFDKKLDKGYQEVDKRRLDEVYPEFEQDLEQTAVWAMLQV
jgi:hypothetical protein